MTKDNTLEDVIYKVIINNLNLYCPHCERGVDQDEDMHVKIAQVIKTWVLDKFSKWVDNRIMDTKTYPGYWATDIIKSHISPSDVYRERIDTLNYALINLKNILEVK